MALNERDYDSMKKILDSMGNTKKKILLKYLVEKGYAELGLKLVNKVEEKFSIAIQSSNFELAFELCSKMNTQEYWKMLGEEAQNDATVEPLRGHHKNLNFAPHIPHQLLLHH